MDKIIDELTTEHDIYISIGLKHPMKPSECRDLIDSLLVENFTMSSWGTHTKDEYIQIVLDQESKIKSLKSELETITHLLKSEAHHKWVAEDKVEALKIENKKLQSSLDQVVGTYHEQIWNS